jgi:tetratricopeptide (TPR) repeat protein
MAAGVTLLLSSSGCGLNPRLNLAETTGSRVPVELTETPFYPQEAHHCGPASLLTMLEASGVDAEYGAVVDRVYVPGLEGSLQVEMLAAAREFGRIPYVLPPAASSLLEELSAGRPVLVLLNLGLPRSPVWHYAVLVGFDPVRNQVLLHSGRTAWSRQRAPAWLRRWSWAGRWAVVLLSPGEWPTSPDRERMFRALADFEDRADPLAAGQSWAVAAEAWPEEVLPWLGIGNAAHRRGDWEAAVDAYERALDLEPEHLPARLNLALSRSAAGAPCEGLRTLGSAPPESHPLAAAFAELDARLRSECN